MVSAAEGYLMGQVELALDGFAERSGARVVHGLLLELGERMEMIDHVLIDRYGALVIDVQPRPSARVAGSSKDRSWTARISKGRRQKIESPLRANTRRAGLLCEALRVCGRSLAEDYFSDMVVFAGADIEGLQLSDAESLKVVDSKQLVAALQARHDFAVNAGVLEPHEVADVASLVRTLDRSDDPGARLRLETPKPRKGLTLPFGRKVPEQAGVSAEAVGFAPVAVRLANDRFPDVYVSETKPTRSSTPPIFLLAMIAAVAVWLFAYGGLGLVQSRIPVVLGMFQTADNEPVSRTVQTPLPGDTALENAKAVLRTNAPAVYEQIGNPNSPEIASSDQFTSYTWHYTPTRGSTQGQPQWISLTFDANGVLRGVDAP